MKALKKVFGNWWVLSIGAAVLLAVALAFLLPFAVGFLRPLWVRLTIVAVIALIWAGLAAWRVISARKASDRLAKSLAQTSAAPGEGEALAKRMNEALAGLKTASGNKRDYLYSRPWYVIIGPPGAGKTTALLNSGLRFPFSDTALKGVGGTRNLDFWFADEAVLVDTAGRYTTQDSDAERDKGAWKSFLELLRKNRPLQPINGVLVAIGLDELVGADAATIDRHSATVRRRLAELQQGLEVSAPVYVMFTKADLVAGFAEFYDDLDVEGRRAVLGSTLPWDRSAKPNAERFAEAFDGMAQAISDRTSKRLQEDLDARRRGLIVGFPAQMAGLRSRVVRFLDGAFPADAPEAPAAVRGFYFTSGVQQGTPLDRILSGVAAVYDAPARPASGQGRAYFINRLLQDVVIAEAGLVQTSAKARARRSAQLTAAMVAIAAVSVLALAAWTVSFLNNRNFQNQLAAGGTSIANEIRANGVDLVEVRETDADLEQTLSILRGLRNLPRGYAERRAGGAPLLMGFGLFQRSHSQAAEEAYLEGLRRILLPRILLRVEKFLAANQSDPLTLYEPLKVYLMLGGQAPSLDRRAVSSWVESDWEQAVYPGADREGTRKELAQHLKALLEDPQLNASWVERRAPLDGGLLTASRSSVQTLSLADRAYAVLKQKAAASGKEDWQVGSVLSAGDARAFANGEALLAKTVPYFFTRPGFEQAYQVGLQNIQSELEKDLWVMGSDQGKETIRQQMAAVRPGVAGLYSREYIQVWEGVVNSLQPANYFGDPAAFGAATGAPSPLKVLLLEVRKHTNFTGGTNVGKGVAAVGRAMVQKSQALSAAQQAGIGAGPTSAVDAGRAITDYFKPLHDFVGDGKAPAPVDDFVAKLKAAVIAKNAADMAGGMGGSDVAMADLNRTMSELGAAAVVAPPMIQGYVAPAAKAGGEARVSSAQGAVSSQYAQTIGPACASVTEGRYPFMTASQNNAPVADLLRVFGLNGQVDSFVNTRLRPLMDTAGPIWRWRADDPVAASLDPTSAGEFQRAAELRDLLLSGVAVRVEPTSFGGTVTAAELSAGGATYRFEAGQPGQRQVQWTPSSLPEARVTLFAGATKLKEYEFDGPWATFRLFDAARKENAGPTAFKATFGEGASTVTFRVTLPSEKNPFSRGGIWSFRCPPRL